MQTDGWRGYKVLSPVFGACLSELLLVEFSPSIQRDAARVCAEWIGRFLGIAVTPEVRHQQSLLLTHTL